MAGTFLAQAYDTDDEWSGDRGPCLVVGWNASSPTHACCDNHGTALKSLEVLTFVQIHDRTGTI